MPRKLDPVSRANVISAIYHLQGQEGSRKVWPTAERIAQHLEADVAEVRDHLRGLKSSRLFRDRQRKGKRVWMPWEEA